jgi:eukaryotic translation initiation factor 2-alpha kinase 4
MEPNEERQQQELTVLESIYGDDFIDVPPPEAWKVSFRVAFVLSFQF